MPLLFDKTVLQGKLLQNFFRCSLMVHRKIKVIMAGELGVGVVMWQRSNPAEVYIFSKIVDEKNKKRQ